ncbi:MAG: acetate--CoA ligase family protein [Candidatus Hydrothermarchaeales archaeon]
MNEILKYNDANKILEEYGLPFPHEKLIDSEEDAAKAASEIGYPVSLKLISPDIIHKSRAGCVLLNLTSENEVREGYEEIIERAKMHNTKVYGVLVQEMVSRGKEVIIGMLRDEQLGPTIAFGLCGVFTEILGDTSFRAVPISKDEALAMIREIKAYKIIEKSDVESIADVISKVSRLCVEKKEILEVEINPLLVYEKGVMILNSRIVYRR